MLHDKMIDIDTISTMYSIHNHAGFIGSMGQPILPSLPILLPPPRQVLAANQLKRSLSSLMLPTADFMLYGVSNNNHVPLEGYPSPSRRQRLEKRVHFCDVVLEVTIPPVEEEEKSLLWWKNSHFDKRRASDQSVINSNSAKKNPNYHDSLVFLMKSYKHGQERDELLSHVHVILQADARGLEHRISSRIRSHRHVHVKEVLRLQKKLRGEGAQWLYGGSEMIELLLRKKSLKLSRPSRQLAFRLAQADTLELKHT
jgi:hypothetical protein